MKLYSEESKFYSDKTKEYLIEWGNKRICAIDNLFQRTLDYPEFKYVDYKRCEEEYQRVGKVSMLVQEDIKKAKEYFFKGALYGIICMKNKTYFNESHNDFMINFQRYEYMYYTLLSGNFDVAQRYAELMDELGPKDKQTDYCLFIGKVLKNVILGNTEDAERWLGYIDNYKDVKYFQKEMDLEIKMMRGINRNDEAMFNEGLSNIIKKSERRLKPEKSDWGDFLVKSAVALTALAIHRGMNITVKSVLLPDEYFADYDIDYKGIEENLRME